MSSGGWPPADGGRYRDDEFGTDQDRGRYFDESGYEWSEPSGPSPSPGDPRLGGRTDPYGQSTGQSLGRHSGRQPAASAYGDGYGQDGYGQDGYGQDAYGQGWQLGSRYAGDQDGRDGYDQGGYDRSYGQDGFSSYADPGYGPDGYGRDPGPDRYAHRSYGQGGYGQDGYGQDGYGRDGYGGEYYGEPPAGRALPAAPDDAYRQEGYGVAAPYQAPGGYQQPDGYGPDNGYIRQPSDTGSFGRPDTGSFGRPDTGSFGVSGGYSSDGQPDPFGPPAASLRRAELGGSASPVGYDQWHDQADDADGWDGDEAADHDGGWHDDADNNGLLSRRFGSRDDGGGGRLAARRAAKARRPKRLRGKAAFTAAILAGALVLGAVADFGYERFQAWHTSRYGDYTSAGTGSVKFTVPPGAALSSLGPALVQAGVIMEARPFLSAANAAQNASHLQPGVYLLHHHMKSALAVEYLLSSAHRVNDQVTIIEGTRASAIAQELAKQSGLPVTQFTDIIDHPPAALGLPSWWGGKTAEGFLFPDTYTLLPKMTALQILQMMVSEFKRQIGAINLVGAAQNVGTSPWHALIVGSLIQAEAGSVKDFGKISRVVWNRLNDNMPLEFDSTIFYAMGKYGTAVSAQQRNFPSPYNTYLHTGLPPGPIGNPGVAAINAAVHATKGQWLYFLTDTKRKPYTTYFYDTLAQFQAAQQEFGV